MASLFLFAHARSLALFFFTLLSSFSFCSTAVLISWWPFSPLLGPIQEGGGGRKYEEVEKRKRQ
jgi:hypothetical protein